MARVLALSADLLFGSRVQGDLVAAGHEVTLVGDEAAARAALAGTGTDEDGGERRGRVDALVVDLTDPDLDGAGIVETLRASGALGATRTLAFYSHVDADARTRAERAGFDVVVARSRMAREGASLVAALLS